MAADPHLEALGFLEELPEQDLNDIVQAIEAGARSPSEALGFGLEALNSIEQIALGYYRARQVEKAAVLFGFVLQMQPNKSTAWRGIGACAQVMKNYELAAICYTAATVADPNDVISNVLLGEVFCLGGETEKGLQMLRLALDMDDKTAASRAYLTRAKAIVAADGGLPPAIVIRQKGIDIVREARAKQALEQGIKPLAEDDADGEFRFNPDEELTMKEARKHPKLRAAIEQLTQHVEDGALTYKDIAGFTDEQMDGAYKIAAGYLQANQFSQASQFLGLMIFLDPFSARFHKLQGICYHRMKQYHPADFHYRLAMICEPKDAEAAIYRGEARVMAGAVDEGLQLIKQGLEQAQQDPKAQDLVKRAQVLLRQLAN